MVRKSPKWGYSYSPVTKWDDPPSTPHPVTAESEGAVRLKKAACYIRTVTDILGWGDRRPELYGWNSFLKTQPTTLSRW